MTIAAPLAVGVIIVVIWEIACRALHVPPFLFPKPSDIAAKLMSDWPALLGALGMTLRVALQAFFAAIVIGTFIAFLFVQSRAIEMSFFPYAVLLQVTPIVDRAVDHHPGQEHADRLDRLRDRGGALSDHLQHHARVAQRRSRPGESVPYEPGGTAADVVAAAHPERATLLLRRLAHLQRARADRRGGRRIRGRHRRTQRRACLREPASGLPA